MVIQSALGNQGVIVFWWATDIQLWTIIVRGTLYLYPPFLLAKAFTDIAKKSGYNYSATEMRWVLGKGYTWNDFTMRNIGKNILDVHYDSPPTAYIVFLMFVNCIFYGIVAWYLDHIIASNRGKDESKAFLFRKNYWCPRRRRVEGNAE